MRDTIDMAREAGWKDLRNYDSQMQHDFFMGSIDTLKALVDLARADEREACAKQFDALGCDHVAAAIRARGNI